MDRNAISGWVLVKHSDVFTKDAIDAYYHRYLNAPCRICFGNLLSRTLSVRPELLSAHTGTCYATRPGIIVDTYRHVLLGSTN
jgi:hypothetical protein